MSNEDTPKEVVYPYHCNLCGEDFYCSILEHMKRCKGGRAGTTDELIRRGSK